LRNTRADSDIGISTYPESSEAVMAHRAGESESDDVALQMAEVAIPQQMIQEILRLIAELLPSRHPRQRDRRKGHAFKKNRRKECVQMPEKMVRSDTRPPCGLPKGAGSDPHLATVLQEGPKSANIHASRKSSGESGFKSKPH
jgi:hypothetical protein